MSAAVEAPLPAEAPRRRRGAPVVIAAPAATAPASAFAALARPDGGSEPGDVAATIRASLRLPFQTGSTAAVEAQQPETAAAEPELTLPETAAAPPAAAPETQSISAWLQDQRRVAARQEAAKQTSTGRGTAAGEGPPEEAPPLSLNQHRATQRRDAVRSVVDVSAFKKPRVEKAVTEKATTTQAPAFDFRAARKQLPHGGGLALAGAGAAVAPHSSGGVVKPARVPFAMTAGVVEPFKPGKRSSAFPQSGNRTQTFNG